MTEQEKKVIKVKGGAAIEDLTVCSPDKRFYVLTADVFSKDGEKIEEGQVLFKDTIFIEDVASIIRRVKNHVGNILSFQSENGGRLENIKLFNITIEEAEERGFLHKPGVIQHTQAP